MDVGGDGRVSWRAEQPVLSTLAGRVRLAHQLQRPMGAFHIDDALNAVQRFAVPHAQMRCNFDISWSAQRDLDVDINSNLVGAEVLASSYGLDCCPEVTDRLPAWGNRATGRGGLRRAFQRDAAAQSSSTHR